MVQEIAAFMTIQPAASAAMCVQGDVSNLSPPACNELSGSDRNHGHLDGVGQNEPAAFQSLRIKRHAQPVMQRTFNRSPRLPRKNVKIAGVWICDAPHIHTYVSTWIMWAARVGEPVIPRRRRTSPPHNISSFLSWSGSPRCAPRGEDAVVGSLFNTWCAEATS